MTNYLLHHLRLGILCATLVLSFISCKKKEEPPSNETTYGTVLVQLNHYVGDSLLILGNKEYTNAVGQFYSVSSLKYYVGNIKLVKPAGGKLDVSGIHLINLTNGVIPQISLTNIPTGTYTAIEFNIGVDSATSAGTNHTGALSHANGMYWNNTDGFIFLQMLGSAQESPTTELAFEIGGYKWGTNNYRKIAPTFTTNIIVQKEHISTIKMKANLAEMFTMPYNTNFAYVYSITAPNSESLKLSKNYMDMWTVMAVIN